MVERSCDACSAVVFPLSCTVGSSDPPFLTTTFGGGQGFAAAAPALVSAGWLDAGWGERPSAGAIFVDSVLVELGGFTTPGGFSAGAEFEQSGTAVFL